MKKLSNFYKKTKTKLVYFLSLIYLTCMCTTLHANQQTVDAIAALVNDDVIMLSEVKNELKSSNAASATKLEAQATLEKLILQKIQEQHANKVGIKIKDTTVDNAIARIAAQNKLTMEQFNVALVKEGLKLDTFKNNIRKELKVRTLRNAVLKQTNNVSDEEVNDLIDNQILYDNNDNQYILEDITVNFKNGENLQAFYSAQNLANSLRKQLLGNSKFLDHPSTLTLIKNKQAIITKQKEFSSSTLPSPYKLAINNLSNGEISNVFRDETGFHIVKLIKLNSAINTRVTQVKVRHILINDQNTQQSSSPKILVKQIRKQLIAGSSFSRLAKQYSRDLGSKKSGGELGWSDSRNYVPEFQKAVNNLPLNTLSEPVKTKFGWHLIEVLDRETSNSMRLAFEQKAKAFLQKNNESDAYDKWLLNLRDKAFVENRLFN